MTNTKGNFAEGKVYKNILAQTLPLLLAELVHMLYNIVDRIYIGRMGDEVALAGVGITFPIVTLIAAFTALFGRGGAPLFSISRGEGNDGKAERVLGNSFLLILISSAILFVLCFTFKKPILYLFGASDSSYVYADEYLRIYLFGTVFATTSSGLNSYINAEGAPKVAMITTVIGALINIALDPIFIFTLNMGVGGAALATVISQAVSAIWVLLFLLGKKAPVRLKPSCMRPDIQIIKKITLYGISGFIMQGTYTLVCVACNSTLQTFGGDTYVSIMAILTSVREVTTLPISALTTGASAVLGYNFGGKLYSRVRSGIKFTCSVGIIYTAIVWFLVLVFPEAFIAIFTKDALTISLGTRALGIYFFGFVFMSLQFAGQAIFQALGFAGRAIVFSLLRKAIIVVPLTIILPHLGFGTDGVFLAEPISSVIGGIACFTTMYFTVYRRMSKLKDKDEYL
ncbi:MAG: MATE family efflux transporter [Clostridia bacterium]|nr:MATE family efflux transporter [Clostridia bacterium]